MAQLGEGWYERGSPLEVLQSPVSECQYFQLNYATFRRDQIREGGKGGRKGREEREERKGGRKEREGGKKGREEREGRKGGRKGREEKEGGKREGNKERAMKSLLP